MALHDLAHGGRFGVAPCRPGAARLHGDGIAGAVHFVRVRIASVCMRVHACA